MGARLECLSHNVCGADMPHHAPKLGRGGAAIKAAITGDTGGLRKDCKRGALSFAGCMGAATGRLASVIAGLFCALEVCCGCRWASFRTSTARLLLVLRVSLPEALKNGIASLQLT